jgi:hemolysin activation/secretion protein
MITTNGLLGLGEQVQLQALTSLPFGEVRFFGGMLIVPLSDNGLVGVFQASRSEAFPGGYLKPLNIAAFGDMYSFGLNYPLITRPGLSVVGTTSIDLFDNTSTVFGGEITSSDERSRAFRLGAIANVDDLLGGQSIVRLIFSQGLEALGARPTGNQVNTRPGMELDASKVVFEINRKQPLPSGFQVDVGMLLQRANGPLPSAEVFDFGGVMYGRAYDSGIISGDHGIAGKIRLSRTIPTGNRFVPIVDPYVFYDIGEVSTALRTPGVPSNQSAASAGVGLRFFTSARIGGSIEANQPLTHQPTVEAGKTDRPIRVFFLLFMQF